MEVGPDVFAEIRFGGEPCGIVSVEAAAKTGLAAGTKLFTGINDNISHCIVQGDADYPTAILGTFGIISMCLNHPVSDPQRICGIQGGFDKNDNWTLSTGIGGVGAMNTWLRENLCAHFAAEANEKGKDVYDILSEHAAMSPIGSHGLYCNPNILGASVDPFVKSSYLNLNLACTLNDIIRAAYEGIAYEIKKFVNIIDNCKGTKSTKLYVSGGCAQSDILVSIIADVLNIDICQSDVSPAHAGVMGAAMIAGIGAGIFKDIDEAKVKMARPGKTVKPTPENVEVYKNLFETYLTCYDGLANHVYTKPL